MVPRENVELDVVSDDQMEKGNGANSYVAEWEDNKGDVFEF